MPNYEVLLYVLITVMIGLVLIWWLQRRLSSTESQRRRRLHKLKSFEAVPTESPLDDPIAEARKKSLANVRQRFTIIRRILILSVGLLVLALISLPFLGDMPTTLVSFLIAAATVIIGIAARPFVENIISGIVITLSRLIRIGDTVIVDEHYGTVEDITPTHCVIKIWDWRRYIVPNAKMINKEFVNYSVIDPYRWVNIEFWVDYGSDMDQVEQLAVEAAKVSKYFANYEDPQLWIINLTKEGVHCMVVAWANSPTEGWMLSVETRNNLIRAFQAHGIQTHGYRLTPPAEAAAYRRHSSS